MLKRSRRWQKSGCTWKNHLLSCSNNKWESCLVEVGRQRRRAQVVRLTGRLVSQGSVADTEEIISLICSLHLYISECVCGALSAPPPLPSQGQFSFMTLLLCFLSSLCCYQLFCSLSLCCLMYSFHSSFWYHSWMNFSNHFNVKKEKHGSLIPISATFWN